MTALGVGTSDAGHTLAVVAAGEEAGRHPGNPFKPEVTQFTGVAGIVLRRELTEVVAEHVLEGVGPVLGVCEMRRLGRGGNGRHASRNSAESRYASVRFRVARHRKRRREIVLVL